MKRLAKSGKSEVRVGAGRGNGKTLEAHTTPVKAVRV